MPQTPDEMTQNLAERLCWEVARRDDARVARRRYRTQVVDGVYRLDAGALLDEFLHCLEHVGVMALLADVDGTAIHREMVPCVQDCRALRAEAAVWHRAQQRPAGLAVQR